MKSVIVLGSGNSGAGAIKDYLMSRKIFKALSVTKNLESLPIGWSP